MAQVIEYLPQIEGQEAAYIAKVMESMEEGEAKKFARVYSERRQDPQTILLATLAGFVVIAGVQRFLTGSIWMGVLYLFTAGLCLVGTIVDLINYKNIAFEYNREVAQECVSLIR